MSSEHGKLSTKLRIDGVTWPGGSNNPPKGRPNKFKLRVATLQEEPFVTYKATEENGKCSPNSLPCKIRLEPNTTVDSLSSSGNIEVTINLYLV